MAGFQVTSTAYTVDMLSSVCGKWSVTAVLCRSLSYKSAHAVVSCAIACCIPAAPPKQKACMLATSLMCKSTTSTSGLGSMLRHCSGFTVHLYVSLQLELRESHLSTVGGDVQVNDILEGLLQQLQAHNNPHVGAVQAAMNLAGGAVGPGQRSMLPQVNPTLCSCLPWCTVACNREQA